MGFIDDKRSVSETAVPIKPRRTKGTYSFKFRNYFASGIIGAGLVFGAIWMILPNTGKIRSQIHQHMLDREELKNRANLMSTFGPSLTAEGIQKIMDSDTYDDKRPRQ